MNELAERYIRKRDVMLISWDGVSKRYVPAQLPNLSDDINIDEVKNPSKSIGLRSAKRIIYSNKATEKLYAKVRSNYSKRKNKATTSLIPEVEFMGGDALLILADWHGNDEVFIRQIQSLHANKVKIIQVCHDLIPVITPQYAGHSTNTFKRYIEAIYPICDLVLCNSKNTENDVKQWLNRAKLSVPNTEVFRLGDDFRYSISVKPKTKSMPQKFLLCVGTVEARKNHTVLYYAYKLAASKGIKLPPLIIVGRKGWLTEDIYEIINNDPEVNKLIIFMENLSDEELTWLYENCMFTVYASFYEGWGLPIAESVAHGVPCLASNTSSMTEIAGDLIEYFSPASSDDCLQAILRLSEDESLKLARERVKKYKPTTWDQTFNQVERALKREIHE